MMKKRKSSMRAAVARADREFGRYIRERDGSCVLCGARPVQCGHIISRSQRTTRWDDRNAFGQCAGCNLRHEYNPEIFINWFVNRFGWDVWERLSSKAHTHRKMTEDEINAIADKYAALNRRSA